MANRDSNIKLRFRFNIISTCLMYSIRSVLVIQYYSVA